MATINPGFDFLQLLRGLHTSILTPYFLELE